MPLDEFDPPKAHTTKIGRGHSWAEPKLDGVRALVHLHPEDGIVITTRHRNKDGDYTRIQDKVPHLRDAPALVELAQRGYTILDGELIMPTGGSSNVMTIVGSNPDVAVNNQLIHGRAQLAVFDIVRCMDLSVLEMPLVDRKVMLQQLHDLAKLPVQLVAHTTIGLTKDARADYMSRCLAAGFEGMVLKDPNAGYHSTTWRKEKIATTVDLKVVGSEPGNGKYAGLIGALVLEWPDGTQACKVAPGSDGDRLRLSTQFSGLTSDEIRALDLWLEVECQEVTPVRSLRHPRILRWRPDLSSAAKEGSDG